MTTTEDLAILATATALADELGLSFVTRLGYSPDQERDASGKFGSGGGDFVPHGYEVWWSMSGGSEVLTEAAAAMTGAKDWGSYSGNSEANEAAAYFLGKINSGDHVTSSTLYSGHMRPEVVRGDKVEIPLMAMSSKNLAEVYADKSSGAASSVAQVTRVASDMADLRAAYTKAGSSLEVTQTAIDRLYKTTGVPTAPPSQDWRPTVYSFPRGTPSAQIRENEQVTSGRFTVGRVKEGRAIDSAWVDPKTDTVNVVHAVDVQLHYDGPLPITEDTEGYYASVFLVDDDGDPWTLDDFAYEVAARLGYSEDQQRDEQGRWGEGGGGTAKPGPEGAISGPVTWTPELIAEHEMPQWAALSTQQRDHTEEVVAAGGKAHQGEDPPITGWSREEMTQRGEDLLQQGLNDPALTEKYTDWYGRQRDAIDEQAGLLRAEFPGADPPITNELFAGVVAGCSIRAQWDDKAGNPINIDTAAGVVRAFEDHPELRDMDPREAAAFIREQGTYMPAGGAGVMSNHLSETQSVFNSDGTRSGVYDALSGTKVSAFYDQFQSRGTGDHAVIDTLMLKGLTNDTHADPHGVLNEPSGPGTGNKADQSAWTPGAGGYAEFDSVVSALAEAHNMSIGDTQALIWGAYRGY